MSSSHTALERSVPHSAKRTSSFVRLAAIIILSTARSPHPKLGSIDDLFTQAEARNFCHLLFGTMGAGCVRVTPLGFGAGQ